MDSRFQHIVVGGGISGLGTAHFATARGVSTLVLESENRVGGCINSRRFPTSGEFWVEAGSHSCFNSYGNLLEILHDLGLTKVLTAKQKLRYSLYRNGERKSIFSALHPIELALSLPKLLVTGKEGKSVADYYSRVVGKRNYNDLFSAAFSSVICQPAGEFPAELLFRKKPRDKDIVRSFTMPDGLSQIPQAIASQGSLQTLTGKTVVSISREHDGFRVLTNVGEEYGARYITLAVPPDIAVRLLPDVFTALREKLYQIEMTQIESLAICVPKASVALDPLAGLIAVNENFYSMVSRDYLGDDRYRGFTFHFKPDTQLDREAQLACCANILGLERDQIKGHSFALNRLPALRRDHPEQVKEIDAVLHDTNLALTGNYFFGVSIEDCLIRSRQEFERLFS